MQPFLQAGNPFLVGGQPCFQKGLGLGLGEREACWMKKKTQYLYKIRACTLNLSALVWSNVMHNTSRTIY